jgi:hypothetical protein
LVPNILWVEHTVARLAEQGLPSPIERDVVVVGHLERVTGFSGEREAVLDLVDLLDIVWVGGSTRIRAARSANGVSIFLHRHRVGARFMEDPVDVVILIDDHYRQVPLPE